MQQRVPAWDTLLEESSRGVVWWAADATLRGESGGPSSCGGTEEDGAHLAYGNGVPFDRGELLRLSPRGCIGGGRVVAGGARSGCDGSGLRVAGGARRATRVQDFSAVGARGNGQEQQGRPRHSS